jgi:hypothetical protein
MKYLILLALILSSTFGHAAVQTAQSRSYDQMVTQNNNFGTIDKNRQYVLGVCEFELGSCNGSTVTLLEEGEKVFSTTITSRGEFKTPNLKNNKQYKVSLEWPKHNIVEVRDVKPGEFVVIKFSKSN